MLDYFKNVYDALFNQKVEVNAALYILMYIAVICGAISSIIMVISMIL